MQQRTGTFGWVIGRMKTIKKARFARKGWNGKSQWIELQEPDEHSKMTLPYIFIRTVQGSLVPWLASQTDMLGEDWFLFGPQDPPVRPHADLPRRPREEVPGHAPD